MFNSNGVSLADIAAVTGNNRNNDGWGNDAWWIVILLIFGWGNGGFGGFGNNGERAATQSDVRAAVDQQTLISKLDQQTYGLADSTYALNNTINGNFRTLDNSICSLGYQNQQGFNDVSHQISDCCCRTNEAIQGVNYNISTQTNALQNALCNSTRDIIDNQNCNTRSILDFLVNDKVATLQAENQNLKLAASQADQNQYLSREFRQIIGLPFQSAYGYGLNNGWGYNVGCGYNTGCC